MTRRLPARGSVAVELALVLPVVFLLLLGVVEIAAVGKTQLQVSGAAREGARQAAAAPEPARAVAAVRAALGPGGDDARISVRRAHVVGGDATVEVRVPHRVAAALWGGVTVELRGRAVMRVER